MYIGYNQTHDVCARGVHGMRCARSRGTRAHVPRRCVRARACVCASSVWMSSMCDRIRHTPACRCQRAPGHLWARSDRCARRQARQQRARRVSLQRSVAREQPPLSGRSPCPYCRVGSTAGCYAPHIDEVLVCAKRAKQQLTTIGLVGRSTLITEATELI